MAQKMGFTMLWDSAKEVDYPWMEITTRRAEIKADREKIMDYMKAHLEGIALFKRDANFGRKVIKKVLKIDDDDLINESYEIFSKCFSRALPEPAGDENQLRICRHHPSRRLEAQTRRVRRRELRLRAGEERLYQVAIRKIRTLDTREHYSPIECSW